jgi:hypothetical protein
MHTVMNCSTDGLAGRVGFDKDMEGIAALEKGKSTKTAIDVVEHITHETEKYILDPLRAYKVWRAVSAHPP